MSQFWCGLLFFWIVQSPHVLVLKNGKTIVCERYEKAAGMVKLYTEKQTFSLPEKLIDWEKSKTATEQRAERQKARREQNRKAAVEAQREADTRSKKEISLTNDEYKRIATHGGSQPVTVGYRTLGNTILVSAMINGNGPYNMVLDTGASITLISPNVVNELGLQTSGGIQVLGISGESVSASYCTLDEVALGRGKVRRLKAAVRAIQPLNEFNIAGLLGQDYLNHFVMSLDSANRTLTLRPHGSGELRNAINEANREALEDPQAVTGRFQAMTQELGGFYQQFLQMSPGDRGRALPRLKQIVAEMPALRNKINRIYNAMAAIPQENIPEAKRSEIARFLSCYPKISGYFIEVQQFAQNLRKAHSNTRDADIMRRNRTMLEKNFSDIMRQANRFNDCL